MAEPTVPEPEPTPQDPVDAGPVRPAGVRGRPSRAELEAKAQQRVADIEAQVRATRAQLDAANARVEARVGRNLPLAIFFGLALGGGFLLSLVLFKELFIVFGAALVGFTAFELATALRSAGRDIPRLVSVAAAVAVTPIAFFGHVPGLWLATLGAIVLVSLWRILETLPASRRVPRRELALDLGTGALIQVYVTFMAGFYLVLTGEEGGQWWTLGAIIVIVSTDVGAYVSGLAFGRRKLAPAISPGKTVEGFIGSILIATVAAILIATLMLEQPWWLGLILGPALALVGTMGDLMESLIKRDLGVKDISSWLPGHGGFLDRLDSVLPSAAVAYALYLIFHG
ncbi:phosphatidate cytidylyltransferase [Homoserinibacter sp. YIM 151385]|uniref:phosphatidate cytidylyltransferase n=1 Tax=Homoserinibacter sp. YIM 151385 TaxID=2985506 RepID=UPI0022F02ABC|nr:phosphatidate cytidylyltransferase [Homoserinibacter sp. YIM 151385]WBU39160.1 phosphatidate cytidylyltransferase [Homoserinibacter sp. YIM 151385]